MRHQDLTNTDYVSYRKFLKTADKWTLKEIHAYQLQKLKTLVAYAYKQTHGYRTLYDNHRFHPTQLKKLADIKLIPFLTKAMIRDHLEDFSIKLPGRSYVTTGGSTGIPLGFYRDKASFAKELASKAHQYSRLGWKEGDPQMVLRGLVINSTSHMQFFPEFNELRCSSYHLTPKWMELFRKKSFAFKPLWLKCYPSSGFILAKYLQNINKPFAPLKGVLCASENLYPYQKKVLEKVFNCRVFSHYGHYETAAIASFCEYSDYYHVLPQYGFVELLEGEIIATSFIMRATPFIRYRTMDVATLQGWSCPKCKRPYQIWKSIDGRTQDFILTKTGRLISSTAINMHDDIFDHLLQFQFYQDKKGEVTFNFIPKDTCIPQVIKDMQHRLLFKLGRDMILHMQAVKKIALTPRGKYRFLMQKLTLPYGS